MYRQSNTKNSLSIVPIIIWYNPETLGENIVIENINTYSAYFEKVIIVDNSKENNSALCSKISNSIYIPNYENLGIAKALNQGCQKAIEMNFEWVLTMDQDSMWADKESLLHFLFKTEELAKISDKNVSFSPSMINIYTKKEDIVLNKKENNYSNEKIVWTSGNIVKLSAWAKVGGYNESLFIDDVDHEFCYKLGEENYNIIRINDAYMNHSLGEHKEGRKYYILKSLGEHKGVRYYYMVRNCLYMRKRFPKFWKDYNRFYFLLKIVCSRILLLRFSDLIYIYKGIKDAKKNKYGKYLG